jgi:hypothetical protein
LSFAVLAWPPPEEKTLRSESYNLPTDPLFSCCGVLGQEKVDDGKKRKEKRGEER